MYKFNNNTGCVATTTLIIILYIIIQEYQIFFLFFSFLSSLFICLGIFHKFVNIHIINLVCVHASCMCTISRKCVYIQIKFLYIEMIYTNRYFVRVYVKEKLNVHYKFTYLNKDNHNTYVYFDFFPHCCLSSFSL